MIGLLRQFLRLNKGISRVIRPHLPQAKTDLHEEYAQTVARCVNAQPGMTIADVGAGKSSAFARYLDEESRAKIIAIDISAAELAENRTAGEKRVADVATSLPLGKGEADMIVSRSVVEHLVDVEAFVQNAASALPAGGLFINVFPSKYALYALINRMLPPRISSIALRILIPGSEGILGFPAYYDQCYSSAMLRVLRRNGFEVVDSRVSYAQADYFAFLLPLYLLTAALEMVLMVLGFRDLAATVLIVARRTHSQS